MYSTLMGKYKLSFTFLRVLPAVLTPKSGPDREPVHHYIVILDSYRHIRHTYGYVY